MVETAATSRPVLNAGLVLGIGMGGFVDGILLHQIFQVHSMLSARVPQDSMAHMRTNMNADGVFHAGMWLAVMLGIVMLFSAGKRAEVRWSGRALGGGLIAGWGVFNVVEGVIDHHLLELHHVIERLGPSIWDWVFLGGSVVLIAIGAGIAREPRRAAVNHP